MTRVKPVGIGSARTGTMTLSDWLRLGKPKANDYVPGQPIRVFRADRMQWTMFETDNIPAELARTGLTFVSNPNAADIILARNPDAFRPHGHLGKRFAIWTDEPRFSIEQKRRSKVPGVTRIVDVMNVHTGIFRDNYHHLWSNRGAVDFDERMRAFAEKPFRIVTIATYRRRGSSWGKSMSGLAGHAADLTRKRQKLAIALHQRGVCDIYGKGWPAEVRVSGENRDGDWTATKREILSSYSVSLAFENTYIPGYVTEKIWDAVGGATLPVYHGADNGIYRDFPRGSFIEAAGKTRDQLADEILQMPASERADRYEACLRTYIPVAKEDRFAASRQALAERTAAFLEEVMSRAPERA